MNRRTAIRYLAAASAGTFLLTSCRDVPVVEQYGRDTGLRLDGDHRAYLHTILDHVLPLPAEIRAEIAEQEGRDRVDFLLTLLNDLHLPEEVEQYAAGFDAYKALMDRSGVRLRAESAPEALALITTTLESEVPAQQPPEQLARRDNLFYFIEKTVDLARRHLTGSGYYLQEYLDYQLIPPPYNGAVDV